MPDRQGLPTPDEQLRILEAMDRQGELRDDFFEQAGQPVPPPVQEGDPSAEQAGQPVPPPVQEGDPSAEQERVVVEREITATDFERLQAARRPAQAVEEVSAAGGSSETNQILREIERQVGVISSAVATIASFLQGE